MSTGQEKSAMVKILAISGSSRKGSYNTALLEAARGLLPKDATMEIFDTSKFPIFSQDLERDPPADVRAFKTKIREADAILFATPEHNYSVSALLKNAIEWGGRPDEDNSWDGKPAAMVSASSAIRGGVRAQLHLRHILVDVNMFAVNRPQVYVGRAQQAFDSEMKLTDETVKGQLTRLLQALVDWAERFRAPGQA